MGRVKCPNELHRSAEVNGVLLSQGKTGQLTCFKTSSKGLIDLLTTSNCMHTKKGISYFLRFLSVNRGLKEST